MPKIYVYLGIIIYFYSNEHKPVHVHAQKSGRESKVEFIIVDGLVAEIKVRTVKGKKPLAKSDLSLFIEFAEHYKYDIIQKWMDFFVLKKKLQCINVTKRIK